MGHSKISTSKTNSLYLFFRGSILILLPILAISTLLLSMSYSSASENNSSDTVRLSVPVSCNLTATIASGKEHTISMISGAYESEIGETVLKTSCNDANGYIIYAIGNTDNIEGKNVLSGIVGSTYDIPTGTKASGDISQWAMKLSPVSSTTTSDTPTIAPGYDSYHIIPNTWTKVVSKPSGTMNMDTGSSFTTTYAIYLKGTQPAGTYSGQVKYVMLHPSTAAQPTDTLEHAFALAGKTKVNIYDNNGTNSTDSSTGELIGSFYKMQDMETNICESTSLVDEQNTLQLVDIRDNKLYWVTKLRDGHCWMTQNLDLDLSSSVTLTSETTDLNDNSLMGAYQKGYSYDAEHRMISWTPENSTTNFTGTNVTGWQNSRNNPYSANKTDDVSTGHASLGNYYNLPAAIASNNSSTLTSDTLNDILQNPKNSICPKGWRLPTVSNEPGAAANSANEFARINYLYNDDRTDTGADLIVSPLYFVYSGYIDWGLNNILTDGYYWSNTFGGSGWARYLSYSDSSVNTSNGLFWGSTGLSIRCLSR